MKNALMSVNVITGLNSSQVRAFAVGRNEGTMLVLPHKVLNATDSQRNYRHIERTRVVLVSECSQRGAITPGTSHGQVR